MTTLSEKMFSRMNGQAPRGVWSRVDFLDLGSSFAVEKALQRLTETGRIRRPHRGLYDIVHFGSLAGMIFPPRSSYIDAIARRDKLRIVLDGMTCANDLGLTTAVPATSIIHAAIQPREIEIHANAGEDTDPVIYRLSFKTISEKRAFWAGRPGMRVVQALSWLGAQSVHQQEWVSGRIAQTLQNASDASAITEDMIENMDATPAWMHGIIKSVHARLQKPVATAENEKIARNPWSNPT